ncbi:beta-N-acetylhexosaminidase [Allofournierella sp.]|uniref:beta-N-acetylhexosaminidase n=1 Tax=Allofournierella sp. TaxID=1940256 RepID=UPI003AB65C65
MTQMICLRPVPDCIYLPGLRALEKYGRLYLGDGGVPLETVQGTDLHVSFDGCRIRIVCPDAAGFFRMVGYLLQHVPRGMPFEVREVPQFKLCGAMFDCSRNGVLSVEGFKKLVSSMALMGMNAVLLYMEDVYTVESQPYFGYFRGRYSHGELREMDDFAACLGLELIPCIQALGHLEKALRWPMLKPLQDTPSVLLADDSSTEFVESMLDALAENLRTRRIHLGMDEAQGLGTGRYRQLHGEVPALEILRGHLARTAALCAARGLRPMVWSDVCLCQLSALHDYYDTAPVPAALAAQASAIVPAGMDLVYWDYYHTKQADYAALIRRHRLLGRMPVFAGGAWTWNGLAPNYGLAFRGTDCALTACKELGVEEVFCTCWGDNGAETSPLAAMPVLQLFAEHAYRSIVEQAALPARFAACCGGNWQSYLLLNQFDETPGVQVGNPHWSNPSKYLFYQDPLLGLFDWHVQGLSLRQWYGDLTARLEGLEPPAKAEDEHLFRHYLLLARALQGKALLGAELTAAYRSGDRESLRRCLTELETLPALVEELRGSWSSLWLDTNKVFGFEVIDMRLGALCARLRCAREKLHAYLSGAIDRVEELEAERMPFDGDDTPGHLPDCALWDRIVSANPVSAI